MILSKQRLHLQTRLLHDIDNEINREAVAHGQAVESNDLRLRWGSCTHRPTEASYKYNCHGLTFASRRTQIWSGQEVRKILADDGYVSVRRNEAEAGDVVVYVDETGDPHHSGIILSVDRSAGLIGNVIKVLSKWGTAHEVIHSERECPYPGVIEYYRLTK